MQSRHKIGINWAIFNDPKQQREPHLDILQHGSHPPHIEGAVPSPGPYDHLADKTTGPDRDGAFVHDNFTRVILSATN